MKHIKKFSVLMILSLSCNDVISGKNNYKPAGVAGFEKAGEVLQENLPAVSAALAGFGSEFGLETLKYAVATATVAGGKVATGATVVGTKIAAVGTVVAASPATPFVLGGVVTGIIGYNTYRYVYPTNEEIAREEGFKVQAEKHRAEAAQQRELITARVAFRECLTQNSRGERGSLGVPINCERTADTLAFMGQYREIEEARDYLNKYNK